MSFDFYIGNAVIEEPWPEDTATDEQILEWNGRPRWRMTVEPLMLDEAPAFPGDANQHVNHRHPGYMQWRDFCEAAGLVGLFYDEDRGLLEKSSGCVALLESDWREVHEAAERWYAKHQKEPGWNKPPHPAMRGGDVFAANATTVMVMLGEPQSVDGDLDPVYARLLWLRWWFRWALDHCERPAFHFL